VRADDVKHAMCHCQSPPGPSPSPTPSASWSPSRSQSVLPVGNERSCLDVSSGSLPIVMPLTRTELCICPTSTRQICLTFSSSLSVFPPFLRKNAYCLHSPGAYVIRPEPIADPQRQPVTERISKCVSEGQMIVLPHLMTLHEHCAVDEGNDGICDRISPRMEQ